MYDQINSLLIMILIFLAGGFGSRWVFKKLQFSNLFFWFCALIMFMIFLVVIFIQFGGPEGILKYS